ncbi:hypothetical protein LJR290_006811 [Variovorax sp. LjRoot290]|uniref:hypothetical protein n=1 Tax=Variovorax sp. LjRoot290 TaxID=3342316 RepID=UPI003ECD11A9
MAECQRPGASVAAVPLAHGLNVNLVRKWLVGKGLKRTGLSAPRTVTPRPHVRCGSLQRRGAAQAVVHALAPYPADKIVTVLWNRNLLQVLLSNPPS